MTDLRKAAEIALQALLTCDVDYDYDENPYNTFDAEDVSEAIEALRQALAQPEREWVGLTEDDLRQIILASIGVAEAKLKEKNNG